MDMEAYRSKQGTNFLAIIPPEDMEQYFGLPVFIHRNIGVNQSSFLCPQMMKKERCPICEERSKLRKLEGADPDLIKAMNCFPPRYLFYVMDMTNQETIDKGVMLFDAPQTINDNILALSTDKRSGDVIDISDLDDGRNLIFERKGQGIGTTYTGFELEERTGALEISNAALESLPELSDLLLWATYDDMQEAMADGGSVEGEEDTDDEDIVKPSRRPSRRRARHAEVEEDDDVEDEEDAGDDEAEEDYDNGGEGDEEEEVDNDEEEEGDGEEVDDDEEEEEEEEEEKPVRDVSSRRGRTKNSSIDRLKDRAKTAEGRRAKAPKTEGKKAATAKKKTSTRKRAARRGR